MVVVPTAGAVVAGGVTSAISLVKEEVLAGAYDPEPDPVGVVSGATTSVVPVVPSEDAVVAPVVAFAASEVAGSISPEVENGG